MHISLEIVIFIFCGLLDIGSLQDTCGCYLGLDEKVSFSLSIAKHDPSHVKGRMSLSSDFVHGKCSHS